MADRIALTLTRSLILDERTGKGTATFQKLDEGQAWLRIGFREWKMEIFYSEEGGWVSVSGLKHCRRAMEWKQPKNGQVRQQSSIVYLLATQTTMHHSLTGNHDLSRVFVS